jgi:O-antigen/teichoic acid export membrane protein
VSADFAKSTLFSAMATIATIGGGFLTTVIVARLLGPEAVGILAYAAFVVTLAIAFLDMGVPGTLMRFLPELEAERRDDDARALVRALFIPYALVSAIAAAALFLLLDPQSFGLPPTDDHAPVLIALIAGSVLAQSLANFYYGTLKGRWRFLFLATIAAGSALIQLVVAAIGSLLFGLVGALAAPLAGFLIGGILSLRSIRARAPVEPDLRARATTFAWRTWGTYFLTTVAWSRMEIYFLKLGWGDHAAGLFAAGLNLANLSLQLPMLLTGALIPFLVLKSKSDGHEGFARSYSVAVRYFAMLVLPACLGAAAITPTLLPLIFGSAFADSVVPAMILIAGCSSMAFITIVQHYAFAAEKTKVVLRLAALGALLSILSGLTLTQAYGTLGAAIGRVAAQAVVAVGALAYAGSVGWQTPYRIIARILAASLVCAAIAGGIAHTIPNVTGVAAAILAAILAYAVLIKYLRIIPDEEYRLIDTLASAPGLPSFLRSSFAYTAAWLRT